MSYRFNNKESATKNEQGSSQEWKKGQVASLINHYEEKNKPKKDTTDGKVKNLISNFETKPSRPWGSNSMRATEKNILKSLSGSSSVTLSFSDETEANKINSEVGINNVSSTLGVKTTEKTMAEGSNKGGFLSRQTRDEMINSAKDKAAALVKRIDQEAKSAEKTLAEDSRKGNIVSGQSSDVPIDTDLAVAFAKLSIDDESKSIADPKGISTESEGNVDKTSTEAKKIDEVKPIAKIDWSNVIEKGPDNGSSAYVSETMTDKVDMMEELGGINQGENKSAINWDSVIEGQEKKKPLLEETKDSTSESEDDLPPPPLPPMMPKFVSQLSTCPGSGVMLDNISEEEEEVSVEGPKLSSNPIDTNSDDENVVELLKVTTAFLQFREKTKYADMEKALAEDNNRIFNNEKDQDISNAKVTLKKILSEISNDKGQAKLEKPDEEKALPVVDNQTDYKGKTFVDDANRITDTLETQDKQNIADMVKILEGSANDENCDANNGGIDNLEKDGVNVEDYMGKTLVDDANRIIDTLETQDKQNIADMVKILEGSANDENCDANNGGIDNLEKDGVNVEDYMGKTLIDDANRIIDTLEAQDKQHIADMVKILEGSAKDDNSDAKDGGIDNLEKDGVNVEDEGGETPEKDEVKNDIASDE